VNGVRTTFRTVPHALNDDVELWFETFGFEADPALLLINGLGSQSINYRLEWIEQFLAEGFFVIRFDNRDVGRSTWFDAAGVEGPAYTLADMAEDAVAVLDAAGVDRAHVLGLSMGGMIAQLVAIHHPDRVRSLTSMMSSTGDTDVGRPSPDALEHILAPSPTDREGYLDHQVTSIRTWGSPAAFDEAWIRDVNGEAFDRAFHPDGQRRQMYAVTTAPSRTEALGAVTVPTLVLHGDADRLVDPSGGRRTAEAVPGARFELIEGQGHDYPPATWPTIVRLVTDHARAADHS
jgi:pimeloyl-ACP methyl ester carboxylesterase